MTRCSLFCSALACIALCPDVGIAQTETGKVHLEAKEDRVTVTIGGQLFTEYVFRGYEKPILYPILGPYETPMTRDYPMKKGTANEAEDHPHHKSIWFGHMKVNGQSFWHSGETAGTTEQETLEVEGDTIKTTNRLVGNDGKLVAKDSREIRFGTVNDARFIDYEVTYHATESDIVFGDNKDGQMGIRMHPRLRIKGPIAAGKAVNSEGVRENEIWGKRAAWIDYWAEIDDHTVGIAVFDHPSNLRHPTWWHARDYGLLSANPFGIHHFEEKDDARLGEYTLPKGETLTFKHRFVFHSGDAEQANVAAMYQAWAK